MGKRLLAILLSTPLLTAGVAGAALHVCEAAGGVSTSACDCEARAEHQGHEEHAHHVAHSSHSTQKLEAQPCCSVQASDGPGYVATDELGSPKVDDATYVFAGLANESVPRDQFDCGVDLLRERAPPTRGGPPLFLRNCTLLN